MDTRRRPNEPVASKSKEVDLAGRRPIHCERKHKSRCFRIVSFGRALLYATPAEADSYGKPLRIVTVPHDDPTAVGDTLTWDGASLVVRKSTKVRLNGETVARQLLVA